MKNEIDSIEADLNHNLGRLTLMILTVFGGYLIKFYLI